MPTLLTALEVNTIANVEGELSRISSILVQHSAGISNQYTDIQNYRITEGDFDNSWEGLYTATMHNAKVLIQDAGNTSPYYAGIAKVIMAINLSIASDLWGDVPYSEAFRMDDGIRTPKLDSQEEIYKSIDALLEEAIVLFSKAESDNIFLPGKDDILYNGDVTKWTKASYTLRARYLNRTSNKVSGIDSKILEYLSKGIANNDENLEAIHTIAGGTQNQWGAFNNQRTGYIGGNKFFVDKLNERNDPRTSYFLSKNELGVFVGGDITIQAIPSDISGLGPFFDVGVNYPIVTFYESKFIEAEVKQRQGGNASSVLNDAIKANVSYVTSKSNDGSSIAKYSNASLEDIMIEKWIALYNQSIESYNDYRRTGIPSLKPRPESLAELSYIPKRLPFPKTTTLYNPNAKLIALDVPVWWAK